MLREARKNELKEKLFRTAVELFREKGYENVTVDEITSACGVAKGTFFNHFAKKDHVLLYLGRSQVERMEEIAIKLRQISDPKERVRSLFRSLLSRYENEGHLLRVVMAETVRSALLLSEEEKLAGELRKVLAELLEEAAEDGRLTKRFGLPVLASALCALYFQAMMMTASGDKEAQKLLDEQLDAVWDGFGGAERTDGGTRP
ncbi:TetR/AcrR family transcriptional regulator [Cohnella faecalis]|uniref:TetR/AcrR family transcriptional regulator n=1 Tax=Cohnella faecalis TaxID=2315694 RepID=A0A398CYS2_9BACL|nr:TetR/AcrR family transcriptional regulator [Cohnella faecalis]RIE04381.1 TetR/AcrR family transcriptional regulator [Cohnella faecalis]